MCNIEIDYWRFVQTYKSIDMNWGKRLLHHTQSKVFEVAGR